MVSIATIRTRATVRRCAATVVPAIVALVLPLPASAQIDPGVNYDSGSPAGKEYAIPIALGRAEGAGTEDQQAAANTPFGVGITQPRVGRDTEAGAKKDNGKGKQDGAAGSGANGTKGTNGTAGSPAAPSALTPAMRARLAEAEDVGGTTLWTLGAALLVALSAALLAVALRVRPARAAH